MPKGDSSLRIVIITGDVTIDWNLARTLSSAGERLAWTAEDCTRAYSQRGGAALLADLIESVASELRRQGQANYEIRQMAAPRDAVYPSDERFNRSYAIWSSFKSSAKEERPTVWRVAEFLGLDRRAAHGSAHAADWRRVVDDSADADIVVLDDADLGFREHRELWPEAVTADRCPWIVLKMSSPVVQGDLWEHLQWKHGERLIVVTTTKDLRLADVQISRALSWERTAQDLFWELVHNPRVNGFSKCAHVVISFGAAGAVLLSRSQTGTEAAEQGLAPRCYLFFDPKVIEGMWEQDHPGGMIGYTSCLTAGVCRQLMLCPEQPHIHLGIQRGLAALRTLHLEGYGRRGSASSDKLVFPCQLIAAELAKDGAPFAVARVPSPLRDPTSAKAPSKTPRADQWTILKDRYQDNLRSVAEHLVLEGAEVALRDVPLGQFGHMLTVDRREIESFRSIRALVAEYCRKGGENRPLSIAVFGPPGSGKSFGIIEVANSLLPSQIKVLEFNLSQFSDPLELLPAFHQVRDVGLSGLVPLVFWDEFDTTLAGNKLGWLRYFLAPMQDGGFREGQIVHPLGRCIFVFAGGTSAEVEKFGQGLDPEQFRATKATDFISRLRGFVNIIGPNPQAIKGGADPYYIIRRAILLRSLLQRRAPQLFRSQSGKQVLSIDAGVLRAFLETRAFRHGVRSMEAILAMSLLKGESRFERSCLPSEEQLKLHVDAEDFLALVQQIELEGELLEKLAEAAHEVFCDGLRAKGYSWGQQTSDALKTHNSLKPYAELPEEEKEQNRGNVRDIPNKLACGGYVMVPARDSAPPVEFLGDDLTQLLDTLAEMEHNRWMKAKLEAGWHWAKETDKEKHAHKDLIAWRVLSEEEKKERHSPAELAAMGSGELPEAEKEKDRELVRGIPVILAKAGYTLAKIKEPSGP